MLLMNHLPECTYEPAQIDMEQGIEWGGKPCICDRLRACEQRVNSSNLTMWDRTQEQAQQMVTSGLGIAWKDGFKEGINAAREAVRTIASDDLCCMCPTDEGLTLAAIDALRGDR